jgi:ABC-type Fe3+/spermidine/putrescine transport system ATPase subunit
LSVAPTRDDASAAAAAPELELKDLLKAFDGVVAVEHCDLAVQRGEIMALLGPSGCGKSTLLNLVAGFESPDAGTIRLRGQLLNDVPPHLRNIAMVFQHYAMFPHLTVFENIAYGLQARRLNATIIGERVAEMVSLLKLGGLEQRYPGQLSGGQRQRVAVARALAIRPDMLLLDEAFSALDRNLREEMQLELSLLLRRLGVTAILVTHDQREAFALADRIAVMETGRIAQTGKPQEVYQKPRSSHVLRFLGTTNALHAALVRDANGVRIRVADSVSFATSVASGLPDSGPATVYLRAEDVTLVEQPTAVHTRQPATVALATFLGAQERIVVTLGGQQIVVERPVQDGAAQRPLVPGQAVFLEFDPVKCHITGVA